MSGLEAEVCAFALGVTGAPVPREYGGEGLGMAELAPVWRTLSHGWISPTGAAIKPIGLAAHEAPRAEVPGEGLGEGARQMLDALDVGRDGLLGEHTLLR